MYYFRLLSVGASAGHWIFLANCHLSLSWMPKLDKIVETLQTGKVNPKFRLWLSSSPHPEFPISILQTGIKMTTEPPRVYRQNIFNFFYYFVHFPRVLKQILNVCIN